MGYFFLWLSGLAYSLLIVATIAALAARCKKKFWRRFWPISTASFIFFTVAAMAVIGGFLLIKNVQPKWLFWYGLAQTLAYLIGVVIILKRGLKGVASNDQKARSWSWPLLAAAFGLFLFVYGVVFNFINIKIMVDLANIRTESTGKIDSLVPPHLPDNFNAHHVYEQAAQALGSQVKLPEWFWDSHKPDFNPASNDVARLLEKYQSLLAMLHRAAAMSGYSMEVDITNFIEWPIPRYMHYQIFAKLLSLSARSKAMAGNPSGALKDLAAIEGMAEHLRSYPLLISFAIANAVEEIQLHGLEHVLAHTRELPAGMIDLPVIAHPSVLPSFLKVQRLEAQGNLQFFAINTARSNILSDFGPIGVTTSMFWRVFFSPSELRAVKDIIAFRMGKAAESYEEIKNNLKGIVEAQKSGELGIMTSISTPDYARFLLQPMKYDALRGINDLAMAATAFRNTNGHYPRQPNELVTAYLSKIPSDPFDNQPLKLKPIDGGLHLYSSGPGSGLEGDSNKEPIHFYLGQRAYEEHRIKIAREERRKKAIKKKKRK